jgi:two-component system sensor histidine kinase KdpD
MNTSRPNPDELLDKIKKREAKIGKGKLKIFFGMSPGVGKTYSMLQEAHDEIKNGTDAVIGYIETHGREETEALVAGIPLIPRKKSEYNNIQLEETDTDAILQRRPALVLVDELAHTNAPGSRHKRRYQDVLELLDKGISVFTTINVQHLESQANTVAQITGIIIRETVPDSILDYADEIELIDISPDELLERLRYGKVYKGDQTATAIENFFKIGNLTALREMALRLTANRVDKQLRDYMQGELIEGPWKSGLRILVAISPSPTSENLIRWTRGLAYSLNASWIALYIETSKLISEKDKTSVRKNLELARELGAEIVTFVDEDIVGSILRTAKQQNVSQILTGKPEKLNFISKFYKQSIVENLINKSGNIDVYVVGSDVKRKRKKFSEIIQPQSNWVNYFFTALIVSLITLILYPLSDFTGYQTVAMILLLSVALLPLHFGPGPVLLAAGLSALLWDFFFIPPKFTFNVYKVEDILMLALYFIIAIVTSVLTSRIRAREYAVRNREFRAIALYNLANDLSATRSLEEVLDASVKNINNVFEAESSILQAESSGILFNTYAKGSFNLNPKEFSVATWAFSNNKRAGRFTDTLPSAEAIYYPLSTPRKIIGTAAIKFKDKKELSIDDESLLATFVKQISVAVERELLNETAKRSLLLEESEKLYKNLFSSLSHELRTPISAILGSANYLLQNKTGATDKNNQHLAREIHTAGMRLNRLVENLLDMTRLESGRVILNLKWHDIRDIINSILKQFSEELTEYKVSVNIPEDTPLVKVDYFLIEQSLKNIIFNALIYTPKNTEIKIKVYHVEKNLSIAISDNGPGIPAEALESIFNKFYRVHNSPAGGTGLGLSIARGFIEAHNGSITAENKKTGGTEFIINLPLELSPNLSIQKEEIGQQTADTDN